MLEIALDAVELRRRFNDARFWERLQSGDLRPILVREREAPAGAHQPRGTRSQIIAYLDGKGHRVAIVHQYLRPDGTLGGSGRPDPKMLVEGVTRYVLKDA